VTLRRVNNQVLIESNFDKLTNFLFSLYFIYKVYNNVTIPLILRVVGNPCEIWKIELMAHDDDWSWIMLDRSTHEW